MLAPDCCCRECCGFDEWYIFGTKPTPLGSICHANVFETAIAPPNVFQFINFGGFQLSNPQMKAITDLFWTQMAWVRPNPTWEMVTVVSYSCHLIMNASAALKTFSIDPRHETQINDRG
jgi:hypothetical protein